VRRDEIRSQAGHQALRKTATLPDPGEREQPAVLVPVDGEPIHFAGFPLSGSQ
jgi:hypothetical protein